MTHTKAMMERKRRYEVQELLKLQNMNRWQYEIYYWRRFRTLVSWEIKGTVRPEKLEFDEVTRSILQKFVQGDFWVRSRSDFSTKAFTEMRTELVIKNKKFMDNSVRCIKRKFLRYAKTMAVLETFFISGSSGLGEAAHENEPRLAVPSCHGMMVC